MRDFTKCRLAVELAPTQTPVPILCTDDGEHRWALMAQRDAADAIAASFNACRDALAVLENADATAGSDAYAGALRILRNAVNGEG